LSQINKKSSYETKKREEKENGAASLEAETPEHFFAAAKVKQIQ
jgi:hypothetical protein